MTQQLPQALALLNTWLVWRAVPKTNGTGTRKIPYYVNGTLRSDHNSEADRAQLASYDQAREVCRAGNYSGIGIAVLPDSGIVAVDFDDVVHDGQVDPRVEAAVDGTYAEYSPSGTGVRAFFAGSLPSRKDNNPRPGQFEVEFFGNSGFVTFTGRVLESCEMFGNATTLSPLTPAISNIFSERFGHTSTPSLAQGDMSDMLALLSSDSSPRIGLTLADSERLVGALDPDCSYDEWWPVGAALHHEHHGSEEALNIFDAWSKKGRDYPGRSAVEKKWKSFGDYRGAPRTMAWVLKVSGEARSRDRYDAKLAFSEQIKAAPDEFALREKVCAMISADERLTGIEREALAQTLQAAFKALGEKLPITICRKLVEKKRAKKDPLASNLPEWCGAFVYVTDDDKFFRAGSQEWLTMQAFNAKFGRHMDREDDGQVRSAAWTVLNDWGMRTVTRAVYLPWADDYFVLDGVECINGYRPDSVPEAAPTITETGQGALKIIMEHFALVVGGRQDIVDILLSWIAFNVQHPGRKIRWAPLIKGVEGDGKSIIGKLIRGVLGDSNVKDVSPVAMGSQFTGWAEGSMVALLEEVRVVGHSRHEIFNALKPFITNDKVAIHRKGKDEYNIINVTNYFGFTNYADALPIDDNSRRIMVVFTPWESGQQFRAKLGDTFAYFNRLHKAIEDNVPELRRFFLDWKIPDTFHADGNAPETEERGYMIGMGRSDEEDAVRDAIEAGGVGVGQGVLSSAHLTRILAASGAAELHTSVVNRTLTKIGWTKLPKKVWWDEGARHIWIRGAKAPSNEALRKSLEETREKAPGGGEHPAPGDSHDPFEGLPS